MKQIQLNIDLGRSPLQSSTSLSSLQLAKVIAYVQYFNDLRTFLKHKTYNLTVCIDGSDAEIEALNTKYLQQLPCWIEKYVSDT